MRANRVLTSIESAWLWLQTELDNWSAEGKTASFWWRDDDAVEKTKRLEKLIRLSDEIEVPLSLAVIPSRLKPSLGKSIEEDSLVSILQHGYSHSSHAQSGQKKLELGGGRNPAELQSELRQGFELLGEAFGKRFKPVLVPPWNRIDAEVIKILPAIGFKGISTMRVRRSAYPLPGLLQVNTHLDPIHWRHQGGFIGVYPAIAILIQHLLARRSGYRDLEEPTGILTHHLVQNDAVWRFIKDLFEFLAKHPAVSWMDAGSIWGGTYR